MDGREVQEMNEFIRKDFSKSGSTILVAGRMEAGAWITCCAAVYLCQTMVLIGFYDSEVSDSFALLVLRQIPCISLLKPSNDLSIILAPLVE